MHKAIIILLVLAAGCVTAVKREEMQHDGSYRIETGGGGFTSQEAVLAEAIKRADALCTNGYDTKSKSCDAKFKSKCTLIVMCK